MKSKNLLTQLSDLEDSLNNFSFEELSTTEASLLQRSFITFKNQLEGKVWGEDVTARARDEQSDNFEESSRALPREELRRIASVSHHMRTPLNGIIGLTEQLKEGKLSDDQQFRIDAIQEATKGLMNMLNELSEFSRLYAGLETFEQVSFNFHNLVEDVKYLCETLIIDHCLVLRHQMDPAIPKNLIGDPSKLSQVLLHLLGFTLKNLHEGHIKLEVQFIYRQEEQVFLEFLISNEVGTTPGETTPSKIKPKPSVNPVFQKSTDTGLGLPIVSQIVDQLGGELHIKETSERLVSFVFRLPFGISTNQSAQESPCKKKQPLNGARVLVFEDNPLNEMTMNRRLRSWGCTPFMAGNLTYGLTLLQDAKMDIIILDFKTSDNRIQGLLRDLRQISGKMGRALPIILLSTRLSASETEQLVEEGITDIIIKPYGSEELYSKLLQYAPSAMVEPSSLPSSMNRPGYGSDGEFTQDLAPVLEDCMGNMVTVEELVDLYKQKAMEFIGSVKLHLDRSDFKGIAFSCQKISSSLKLMRTENLLALVNQMFKTSRTNQDLLHIKFLHHCFMEEYPGVETALIKGLEQLKKRK